ncbi:hypothetical protein B0H17DRAFT_1216407 [Mycena rosella]|uniref:Uncharacterized protein n=1 Tax=Mycena rosella TaxID=1033263 RepID=A0AAD7C9D4_MYCRO|nr:hypothetical protein B0H17DRAFT_1216407 [Mycena rosella]
MAIAYMWCWSKKIVPLEPVKRKDNHTYWNINCDDNHALLQMKLLDACSKGMADITDVLNQVIACRVPFELYVEQAEAQGVGHHPTLTAAQQRALAVMYVPMYMDSFHVYGRGGVECHSHYFTAITSILEQPHPVALIVARGLLSFIAQAYDEDLVNRFVSRPSLQVMNFAMGKMLLVEKSGTGVFYMVDQFATTEVDVLIGQVSTGEPNKDSLLWPHPSLLEEISNHYNSVWTPRCYSQLENLKNHIFCKKQYVWWTRKQWIQYLLKGNKGGFIARDILTDDDFNEGRELL